MFIDLIAAAACSGHKMRFFIVFLLLGRHNSPALNSTIFGSPEYSYLNNIGNKILKST